MNKLKRLWITFRILFAQGDIILRPVSWSKHDQGNLSAFFLSSTGKKLDHIIQNEIIAHALTGAIAEVRGYQKVNTLISYLKISAAAPTGSNSRELDAQSNTEDSDGDAELLERLSP